MTAGKTKIKVAELSWEGLNEVLMGLNDEAQLNSMLREQLAIPNAPIERARRIYGRLSVVRREREMKELQARWAKKK